MTSSEAVMFRDVVVGFIENEAKSTARVLAALPDAKPDYRPDDKSRSGWELAAHLALSESWFADCIARGAFSHAGRLAHRCSHAFSGCVWSVRCIC